MDQAILAALRVCSSTGAPGIPRVLGREFRADAGSGDREHQPRQGGHPPLVPQRRDVPLTPPSRASSAARRLRPRGARVPAAVSLWDPRRTPALWATAPGVDASGRAEQHGRAPGVVRDLLGSLRCHRQPADRVAVRVALDLGHPDARRGNRLFDAPQGDMGFLVAVPQLGRQFITEGSASASPAAANRRGGPRRSRSARRSRRLPSESPRPR